MAYISTVAFVILISFVNIMRYNIMINKLFINWIMLCFTLTYNYLAITIDFIISIKARDAQKNYQVNY